MYYYINSFYIYGFIGYIYELIECLVLCHKYIPNILCEPLKPIYGFGIIIILIVEKLVYTKTNFSKLKKHIVYFFSCTIILTIIEYITGKILYITTKKSYWNYSKYFLHIGKYICIWVSILWGIMALIFHFVLKKRTDKIIKKIPVFFTNIILIVTITDILLSLIH